MKLSHTHINLENYAKVIRREILNMSYRARSAHSGGALSVVEILVSLYFSVLRIDPKHPNDDNRDRLLFSKGHDAKALYAVLSERGFFDKEILLRYEINDGLLAGHSVRHAVPGIEISAGSLGHGLSMATGIAIAGKRQRKSFQVYTILSDGECDEGSVWEAALFAGHHKLHNLVVVIDYNKLQGFGFTKDILDLEPFADKWKSFRWDTYEVDGHNIPDMISLFKKIRNNAKKPTVVVAHTVKGFGGVAKYINTIASQYKSPTEEEVREAIKLLHIHDID